MAIPGFQELMLPLLEIAGDGEGHRLADAIEALASRFRLTESDRRELLASGAQPRFDNRVGWARTYLKKAGLLEYPRPGTLRITKRGLEVLESDPPNIDAAYLRRYPEFLEFQRRKDRDEGDGPEPQTPQEILESSYQTLKDDLAQELREKVGQCSARFFEQLVVDLLVAMGYGGSRRDAAQAVGQTGDNGIDGIIKEDKLGLDAVCVQAKKWKDTVGRPVVQGFAGSLQGQRARKGVFITTSQFSREAMDFVDRIDTKIVLIDGDQLAELMIDHGIGVTDVATYTLKTVDTDYFESEG